MLILSPVVTARMGLQRFENVTKGLRDIKKEELVLEKQAYFGD